MESPRPHRPIWWSYPAGSTTPGQIVDDDAITWLRKVHEKTALTASMCTGALILGAAGILKGQPATTRWYKMGVLRIMGAKPRPGERIVRSGKIVTAGGVSSGIDLALAARVEPGPLGFAKAFARLAAGQGDDAELGFEGQIATVQQSHGV
jgi:transcriptional regulator GlxA family with amidase domain